MSTEEDERSPNARKRPEVVDPYNCPPLYVDWIVTGGASEGVINVTFGALDHALKTSDDDIARVMVAARLRMSRDFAGRLHRMLGDILGAGQGAPPTNLVN